MVDLSKRSSEEEIMDDLSASGPVINQTLVELETINTLLGGNYVTLNGLDKVIQGKSLKNTLRIADLGCGGGDILRLVSHWLEKKEINAELIGFDANPNIIAFAQKHTAQKNISYQAVNIFSDDFKTQQFDVVIATLFFHHFDSDQLAEFLSQLRRQTSIGIVINDLHRHWFAYYSIKWLTALFSKSPMVKNDAALSVARSFRKKDWITILEKAGIKQYRMRWMWAFRWQVIID
ncbi:MAG: methyltransferase domain-containing protein [Cytophagia bacterium]|nr:methyltransferase domain-containing protein [Cytophagia bacterium]